MTHSHLDMNVEAMALSLIAVFVLSWILWRIASLLRNKRKKHTALVDRVVPLTDAIHSPTVAVVTDTLDDSLEGLIRLITIKPPHAIATLPLHVQEEGIVAFRFSKAAQYESDASRLSIRETNKRDRARVLAKLFASSRPIYTPRVNANTSLLPFEIPGPKGSNIIIAIREDELPCTQLPRILYLLATYYNLFVIIDVQGSSSPSPSPSTHKHLDYNKHHSDMQARIHTLRRGGKDDDILLLPEDVLPSHRIVAMSTIAGKVAFIRNFPKKVEFILEYDLTVKETLIQFGFTILMYTQHTLMDTHSQPSSYTTTTTITPMSSLARDLLL